LGDGNFAWYQGLQVSLFDVANPMAPVLIRRLELGRRGSGSSILLDHHAFAILPADSDSGRAARVAIPVVLHDLLPGESLSPDPSHFYSWQSTGLAMFDLLGTTGGPPDLVLQDIAISHDFLSNPDHSSYWDMTANAARSLIDADNSLFYLRGEFFVTPWAQGDLIRGPF
jgi:hypothetical protein